MKNPRTDPTTGEWVVFGGTCVAAVVISKLVHLSPKWEHALVYTVLVFTAVLIALRPAWHKTVFWAWFVSVLLVHTLAIYFITRALPPGNVGLQGLLFILSGFAECGAIVVLLSNIFDVRTSVRRKGNA